MTNLFPKTTVLITTGIAILFSAAFANAQTSGRFHIPFQFIMEDKMLPQGDYSARIDSYSQRIELISGKGVTMTYLAQNTPPRPGASASTDQLVFYKYGSVCVFRQIWRAGATQGRELPPSKVEREMARRTPENPATEVAVRVRPRQ